MGWDGERVALVHADDPALRRMAVLDAVVNNADRKGGHILRAADGRVRGVDHGLTFNEDDKLRTVLWGWAGRALTARDAGGAGPRWRPTSTATGSCGAACSTCWSAARCSGPWAGCAR